MEIASTTIKNRWLDLLFPASPDIVRVAATHMQVERLRRQVPNLYAIAIFNTAIILVALWQDRVDWQVMMVPATLIIFCLVRIFIWVRRDISHITDDHANRIVKQVTVAAAIGVSLAAVWCVWSLSSNSLTYPLLGPISLSFGVICVAHCLATVRVPAILALVIGIYPTSIYMVLSGDQLSILLGLTFMTAVILQVRLINEQYALMVKGLVLEKQIRDQANTDTLTGLPNRRAFMERFEAAIDSDLAFGIALIDLDDFKQVNDRLGHLAGDAMLSTIGDRLQTLLANDDSAGRFGGDEFVMLLHGNADQILDKANGVLQELSQRVMIAGEAVPIKACIGFAERGRDGSSAMGLLAAADTALYAAKLAGKAQVVQYQAAEIGSIAA